MPINLNKILFKLTTRLSIIIIGVLFSIIVVELGLRTYQYYNGYSNLQFYENSIIGHAFVSNQNGTFFSPTKEYLTKVSINSHGWPDYNHTYNKPNGTFRIVILGDSFVENIQVPLEKRFFHQVEENLNSALNSKLIEIKGISKFEIIALGRGNTGTGPQYLILKNYGLSYDPDMVIHLFLTANDVKNNLFSLQQDPYLPYFVFNSKNELDLVKQQKRSDRPSANIKEIFKKLRIGELLLSIRQVSTERKNISQNGFPIDYHIYDKSYNQDWQNAWNITKKLLTETKKLTDSNSSYMLFVLANNEQVHPQVWEKILKTYPNLDPNSIDMNKPDNILNDFCKTEKISCYFMLDEYRKYIEANPTSSTHFPQDGHWNENGTNLAAKFITKVLLNYLVKI